MDTESVTISNETAEAALDAIAEVHSLLGVELETRPVSGRRRAELESQRTRYRTAFARIRLAQGATGPSQDLQRRISNS